MKALVAPVEAREPDDVLDPIETAEGLKPVAYIVSGSSEFALRGVAYDDGEPAEKLREIMLAFAGTLAEWPAFVRELFGRLYDGDGCERLPPSEITAWGSSAVAAAEGHADWADLCAAASVSRAIAAKAATSIAVAVAMTLQLKKEPPTPEAGQDPRVIEEEAETAAGDAELAGDEEAAARIRAAGQKAAAAAVAHRRAVDVKLQQNRAQLVVPLARIAQEAVAEADLTKASVALGFSREGEGSLAQVAPELVAALKVDPRLLKIILQAGRVRETPVGAAALGDGHIDVVGVKPTGDLGRTTPSWRTKLAAGGASSTLATLDLLEGQAHGYEMRDRAPRAKGDVGILVDRSGSMEGDREIAARALGVAALAAALADNRRVVAGSFAGDDDVTVRAVHPGNLREVADALGFLCRQADGGTNVDNAVEVVVDLMRVFPGGMRDPDLLLITDGVFDPIDERVLARMGSRRLFGVLVGMSVEHCHDHPEFARCWAIEDIGASFAAGVINTMREGRQGKKR